MKKFSESPNDQTGQPALEFPVAPEFMSFPPRLTLDEYDRLNQLLRDFNPDKIEPRVPAEPREEFELK